MGVVRSTEEDGWREAKFFIEGGLFVSQWREETSIVVELAVLGRRHGVVTTGVLTHIFPTLCVRACMVCGIKTTK